MVKANLHDFQTRAVNELLDKGTKQMILNKIVKDTMDNPIVLSSPTGSGKTIMSISFIQNLQNYLNTNILDIIDETKNYLGLSDDDLNTRVSFGNLNPVFVYFVPSSGGLNEQISGQIKHHGSFVNDGESPVNLVDVDGVLRGIHEFEANDVIVVPWDKYIKKNNILNQITENNTSITQLDTLTSKFSNNRPVVAIIDEAHTHFNDKAKTVVSKFNPDLLIKISATPKESYTDINEVNKTLLKNLILIPIEDVRKSGLIKDKIEIISTINGNALTQATCLSEAIRLQKELTEIMMSELIYDKTSKGKKVTINNIELPLTIIQVDNDTEFKSSKFNGVLADLKTLGLEGSDVLEWMSGKKPTEEELAGAKVLIFKTAIALGWDYPRSHILVKLRETKSKSFDIQTMGRLTRLSNGRNSLDHRYIDEKLRTAYVFVENGLSSTDFDSAVSGLLGNFVYVNDHNYKVKEIKQASLDKFNKIGFRNGGITKNKIIKKDIHFDNIKTVLNTAINQELNNYRSQELNTNSEYKTKVSNNYSGSIEDVYQGDYNNQENINITISDVKILTDMLKVNILNILRNSDLKNYILNNFISFSYGRNSRNKFFYDILLNNNKMKDILVTNSFEVNKKGLSIFLLNNISLLQDIIIKFENEFLESHSEEVIKEGSFFEIKNSLYLENISFVDSKNEDGWLYEKIPTEIANTSDEENEFLSYLIDNDNVEFVYKNGTGGDSFNISYQEKVTHKLRNYYPDFIVVTKTGKVIVVDYKREDVDKNINEKYIAGKSFEIGNIQKVLDAQYQDFKVTMAVNVGKGGNTPIYKYLDSPNYISTSESDYTKYWFDIDNLLK